MQILIAEDDASTRTILKAVVHKWGFEAIIAKDGEDAWEILKKPGHPKLLLLDWEMPGLSGIELCRRIREQEENDPAFIILLTSRNKTEDVVIGLDAGANDYIAKPFDKAELQARMKVGERMITLQQERKTAEEEQSRLQRELLNAQKMEALGQITSSIAHDFNNILGVIMGYTSMSLNRFGNDIPVKMKQYLETTLESSERAKDLVSKMLTYSHGFNEKTETIDLFAEVQSRIGRLKNNLPDTIEIIFEHGNNIPLISLDPMKLNQLLTILCDNAKDAILSESSEGTIIINIRFCRNINDECKECLKVVTGDWVELSVKDKGAGMTDKVITHIFEPFFTTKEFGKGMGMAMLQGIISRAKGHCLIESKLSKGSNVRLLFPPID